ncbi:RNA-polI-A34 multi-domain protein [Pyrenophora tritici-repentis]|nr:RNA-polI-A34 multi-domain protein [Pyrenophora tritici-repentis]
MSTMKKTPVPLPGSKPKSKPQASSSKPQLSQEFVNSDDDSPSESTAQPKKAEKPKTTIGIHVNGVAKKKTKPSKKDAPALKPTPKAKVAPVKPAPKQTVTQKDVSDSSSSDESDDSGDVPMKDIQAKVPVKEKGKDASSDSSDSSGSDSSKFQSTQTYVPPKGFTAVPVNSTTASKSAGLFDNLEGKQVWYMTAPGGVSLKDLEELEMEKVMDGEAVLSYKGIDYNCPQMQKSEEVEREVFVHHKNGLKPVSTRISQILHLRSIVQLPQLSSLQADQNTGSEAAASITRSTIRAPKPQVKGLKMRFLPTGFSGDDGGNLGDSESESEKLREPAGLGMPNGLNLPSKKQKRKHADVNGDATEVLAKKTKKHRTPEEEKRKAEKKARKEKKRAQ